MTADTEAEDITGEVTTQIIQLNPQTCKVSVDGRSGTSSTQGQQIMCELICESNEIMIEIQSDKMNALIDRSSMVSTISLTGYKLLENQPELKTLANLGLEVSVADGSLLQYKGYIECTLKITFLDIELFVPMLVVQDT